MWHKKCTFYLKVILGPCNVYVIYYICVARRTLFPGGNFVQKHAPDISKQNWVQLTYCVPDTCNVWVQSALTPFTVDKTTFSQVNNKALSQFINLVSLPAESMCSILCSSVWKCKTATFELAFPCTCRMLRFRTRMQSPFIAKPADVTKKFDFVLIWPQHSILRHTIRKGVFLAKLPNCIL